MVCHPAEIDVKSAPLRIIAPVLQANFREFLFPTGNSLSRKILLKKDSAIRKGKHGFYRAGDARFHADSVHPLISGITNGECVPVPMSLKK